MSTNAMTHSAPPRHHSKIPDIPGALLSDQHAQPLKERLSALCLLKDTKFPGSQPVSFGWRDIEKLKREDYWVCEKSDGIRVLVFILPNGNAQDVFLIDRHNKYRFVSGFFFPHHLNKAQPLGASVLDGELVVDTDHQTGREYLRLLIFDCLVIDENNVMSKSLLKRTGRLKDFLFAPYDKMLREFPHLMDGQPFQIRLKNMQLSYHLQQVLEVDIPRLMHGNDGLIYTCASSGYVVGTDPRIMKWKPPSENSIDFKLTLRFPPKKHSSEPDFTAKPVFVLSAWTGGKSNNNYDYFDTLDVDDDEWERMKASKEQFDDRIAEVVWITYDGRPRWKLLRLRDDKPNGNYITTVESICRSIADGVEQEDLVKQSQAIRNAWKEREKAGIATTSDRALAQSQQQPRLQQPLPPRPGPSAAVRWKGLATSPWTKIGGPDQVCGFYR